MALDHRSNDRLEAILDQVLDCIDPTRCTQPGDGGTPGIFAQHGVDIAEPEPLQACSSLTIWEISKTSVPSDFHCISEYSTLIGMNVAIFCADAVPKKSHDQKIVFDREARARTAKRLNALVDTIMDCLHCAPIFEPCTSSDGKPIAITVEGAQAQNGLFWRTITFELPDRWQPACCYPDAAPEVC